MGALDHLSGQPVSEIERTVRRHMPKPDSGLSLPIFPDRIDRLLGVLEAMQAWICEFDEYGHMLYASPNVESIIGFTARECLETDCVEFHRDDLPEVIRVGKEVRATGKPAHNQVRVRHKRGHWVWIATSLFAWSPSESGAFHTVSFTRDITELKSAAAARLESDTRYQIVSQMSCDLIFELNQQGMLSYIGPGCEEILGHTADDLMAMNPLSLIHEEDLHRIRRQFTHEFIATRHPKHEPVERRTPLIEYRIRHKDGRWICFETLGLTYRAATGEFRYLAVSRDVTERNRAEQAQRELEDTLQRTQKLESLGVLAGGIAHDFNNLLTPILGFAGLALSDLPEGSRARSQLESIQKSARRAAALTNQMLAYAGQHPLRVEPIDLSKLVEEMRDLLASSAAGKTTLDLDHGLPPIEGEPAQISQIVMNLVTNASEALGDGEGTISVRTGVVQIDAPPAGLLFAEALGKGQHVYFDVEDTGCGMDDLTRARIFDPFYSTKFTGRGLGLAAVAGIVRSHRGAIAVDSRPGAGTCFRVLLPAIGGEVPAEPLPPIALDDWRTTGTALIIDDDEGVRELVSEVLRRVGLDVLVAANGHEGLELFSEHQDSIRVTLLDRTMPALSSSNTFEAIRALRPDATILLVSGYSEERVAAELAGRGVAGFLKKPFLPATLIELVRAALEPPEVAHLTGLRVLDTGDTTS